MNIIDFICIFIILLFTLRGLKRGFIKSIFQLLGTIIVLILSYTFKDTLAAILIDKLPFFNFSGIFNGISVINILVYKVIAFVVLFVVLYCILNIVINLTGIIEKLLELTVILAIPSKILGAIVGLIEGFMFAFFVSFVLFNIPSTSKQVSESKIAIVLLERTPIISNMSLGVTVSLEDINTALKNASESDTMDSLNLDVLHILMRYGIISSDEAQKLIDDKKIEFESNVTV